MRIPPSIRSLGSFLFALVSLTVWSQSVVINEVVTDPQLNWGPLFDGITGPGTVNKDDQWIELLILVNAEDLTGWTIEVNGGTNFSGDLDDNGAFQRSVYFGTGSFTNTQAGEYLVLGDPKAPGDMVDHVHIVLKDELGDLAPQFQLSSADLAVDCRLTTGSSTMMVVPWGLLFRTLIKPL